MSALVEEWLRKAEADFRTAEREFAVESNPNYDAVCFHSQQCAEKLMKALLLRASVVAPKTHDLAYLSQLLLREGGYDLVLRQHELRFLSSAAVSFRYPGEAATKEDASACMRICRELRSGVKNLVESTG